MTPIGTAALGAGHEFEEALHFREWRQLGPGAIDGLGEVELGVEDQTVDPLERGDCFGGKIGALQPHGVEAIELDGIADRFHIGRDVLVDPGTPPHEGVGADGAELVHRHQPGEGGAVLDGHVPGQLRAIRDQHSVADVTIVGQVHVAHDEAPAAHTGHPGGGGAPVDGGVLPDHRIGAHLDPGFLALVLEVLGIPPEDAPLPHPHPFRQDDIALQRGVPRDPAARAHPDPRTDDGERAHLGIGGELSARIDHRGRVDARSHRSTTLASISASATTRPSTKAVPLSFAVLPRN